MQFDSNHLLLVDLSHFEPPMDWAAAKAGGVSGMYTKASQGSGMKDWTVKLHTDGAAAVGLPRGVYHFLDNSDPMAQWENFYAAVKDLPHIELPYILDWENPGISHSVAQVWLDQAEKACGKIPVIYTGRSLMFEEEQPASFARYPVIFARYSSALGSIPAPWTKANAWQFTDAGRPAGVAAGHSVDCNVFYGTIDQLPTFGK